MRVSIVTIGDELLAGDVENSNASWLAAQLSERGVDVAEITVIPDDVARIARTVADDGHEYDAVVVTGGLGSTPDDVTVEGIAAGLDRAIELDQQTHQLVEQAVAVIREEYPKFDFDLDRAARRPAGSDPIPNDEGIAPGFVCDNVYVIPGVPAEMKATFEQVAEEFEGEVFSKTLFSTEAESHLNEVLSDVRDEFDVTVGCYPDDDGHLKRLKLTASDPDAVAAAYDWLADRSVVERTAPT
jgi:nicotinamide-nucleotide amidase